MTQDLPQTEPLRFSRWTHALRDIPPQGRSFERTATPDERRLVSKELDLASCDAITAHYTLTPKKAGTFDLTGRLDATITQVCVVTLEPVPAKIDEILRAEFLAKPRSDPQKLDADLEILTEVAVETITDDLIDIGRFCFEVLSASIDPYPKTPQATLPQDLADHMKAQEAASGPFKDLAKWKDRQNRN